MMEHVKLMEAGVGLRTGPHVQQPALPMHRHKYAAEDVSVQLLRMVGNTVKERILRYKNVVEFQIVKNLQLMLTQADRKTC